MQVPNYLGNTVQYPGVPQSIQTPDDAQNSMGFTH